MQSLMKEEKKESKYIPVKEIAEMLEVTPAWVYELLEKKEIPNFKIQSKYFVERSEFFAYLDNKKNA